MYHRTGVTRNTTESVQNSILLSQPNSSGTTRLTVDI
jgi:hypothetical protein